MPPTRRWSALRRRWSCSSVSRRRSGAATTVTVGTVAVVGVGFSRIELGSTGPPTCGRKPGDAGVAGSRAGVRHRATLTVPVPADHRGPVHRDRPAACDSAHVPVVVHLSDIHFGAHRQELADSLLADIAGIGPDLVVISGDLTQRARRGQFDQARAFIDRLPTTTLTVVGNHDIPLVNLPRRLLSGTRRYERSITGDLDPVVAVEGLVAVGLDTMPGWRWKAGHVSPRQVAIVRDVLGNAPPGAWRLLVTHHPVLPDHLSGLVGRGQLVGACAEAGVALLLSGHTHTPTADVVDLDGLGVHRHALAVVSGTAVSSRTRGTANAYGVIRLDGAMVEGATITVEVRDSTGAGWSEGRVFRFGYTSDGVVAGGPPT